MSEPYVRTSHWMIPFGITNSHTNVGNITGNSSAADQHTGILFNETNSVSGVLNPNWRDQVRLGQNATTAFVGKEYSGESSWFSLKLEEQFSLASGSGYQHNTYESYGHLSYPLGASASTAPSSLVTDVTNRCIRRFLEEFEKAFSSDNLTGRSIKHFKHDVESITHPMKGIRAEISSYLVKLGKLSQSRGLRKSRLLQSVREAYLEFTFGITPFTEDVTAILVDLSRYRFPSVPIQSTASGSFTGSNVLNVVSNIDYFPNTMRQNCKVTSTYSVRYKGAVRTQSGMDGKIGFIQSQRLLPRDWVPTLFSILPYAWMVDYFTNVGDIIDGLCFRFSDLAWGCKTIRTVNDVVYSDIIPDKIVLNSIYRGTVSMTAYGGSANFKYKEVDRSVIVPTDLVPVLAFTIPTRPRQYLNMMAAFLPRVQKLVSLFTKTS